MFFSSFFIAIQTIFVNEETPIIANEANNAKPEPPKRASSLTLRKPLPSVPIQHNDDAPNYDKRALPPTPRNDDEISQTIDESPSISTFIPFPLFLYRALYTDWRIFSRFILI